MVDRSLDIDGYTRRTGVVAPTLLIVSSLLLVAIVSVMPEFRALLSWLLRIAGFWSEAFWHSDLAAGRQTSALRLADYDAVVLASGMMLPFAVSYWVMRGAAFVGPVVLLAVGLMSDLFTSSTFGLGAVQVMIAYATATVAVAFRHRDYGMAPWAFVVKLWLVAACVACLCGVAIWAVDAFVAHRLGSIGVWTISSSIGVSVIAFPILALFLWLFSAFGSAVGVRFR